MDTLKNNLNNSSLLPYDIMYLIYEFADNLKPIRTQLENQEYDLDEIMYERMKKHIIDKCKNQINYYVSGSYSKKLIELNNTNINDVKFKNNIINDNGGYKHKFLSKANQLTGICGLRPNECFQVAKMLTDLEYAEDSIKTQIPHRYTHKKLYKLWVKL